MASSLRVGHYDTETPKLTHYQRHGAGAADEAVVWCDTLARTHRPENGDGTTTDHELKVLLTAVCHIGERVKQQATGHISTMEVAVKAARKAAELILAPAESAVKPVRKTAGLLLKPAK